MKIGLFTDTYYPQINGVATSVLMLKESLELQGHCVYVFTTTDPLAPAGERNVYRIPSIPVNVRRLGAFVSPRLIKNIMGLGLDVIHTHTEFSLGILGRAMARALGLPLVHTMHTIYEEYTGYITKLKIFESVTKAAARRLVAAFCNSADTVIVPTGKVRDLLAGYGVRRDITTVPTGIRLDKFSGAPSDMKRIEALRKEFNIAGGDKVLINIGRISKEKNLDEILLAMEGYLSAHSDVKLLLIGDGPARADLQEMAAELGIEDRVVFAGERPWDEIDLYYKLGNVFVSASKSETQGLTYIEALASGVPVVAREDRCLEDVIQNGVNGFTFTGREELVSALDLILYGCRNQERFRAEAVSSAEKYSATHFARSIALIYETVISLSGNADIVA